MATGKELPTLSGVRVKTRKRDEKQKLDIVGFRDQIIAGLVEAGDDFEAVSKFLDVAGNTTADYRTYGEHFFQVLLAGGLLNPGGTIMETKEDPEKPNRVELCVLRGADDVEGMRKHVEVFHKLLRRYKYLQKVFEEELRKMVNFLKGFSEDERQRLATFTAVAILDGVATKPGMLKVLTNEHLTRDGLSLQFITQVFQVWLKEKEVGYLASQLRKAGLEGKMMELFPANKQTVEFFSDHFKKAGIEEVTKLRQVQENAEHRRLLKGELEKLFSEDGSPEEVISMCQQHMSETNMTDVDITIMLWRCIMGSIDLSKKQDLAGEQALRLLKENCAVFEPFCQRGTPQLWLIIEIQKYCFENAVFLKIFHKIIVLLYKNDILTEDAILKWYQDAHIAKGKREFLGQMKYMIDWFSMAEEESEEDSGQVGEESRDQTGEDTNTEQLA